MSWRLAKSLSVLRAQANELWPSRSKVSDGTIGDQLHASRASDHNPNNSGVVTALDITHDPAKGPDIQLLCDALVASRDKRIKYLICNGRIISGEGQQQKAWAKRKYNGVNKHTKHIHISVRSEATLYDDESPWDLSKYPVKDGVTSQPFRVLKMGDRGEDVKALQKALADKRYDVGGIDGIFGSKTDLAVRALQRVTGLVVDGVAGRKTLKTLNLIP